MEGISIHPPRAGRDAIIDQALKLLSISIHPPRAGRDNRAAKPGGDHPEDFNPPAPCGAGRFPPRTSYPLPYFNPPAPCGAGLAATSSGIMSSTISIHPPRAGRDNFRRRDYYPLLISIHPPRAGRDLVLSCPEFETDISIHPPRAGRDLGQQEQGAVAHISIHPPRAGRD